MTNSLHIKNLVERLCNGDLDAREQLEGLGRLALDWLILQVREKTKSRENALEVLEQLNENSPRYWEVVRSSLIDGDERISCIASKSIHRAPGEDRHSIAWKIVEIALRNPNDFVRERAVFRLGAFADHISERALIACLQDGSWCVRSAAARRLHKRDNEAIVDALVAAFLREPDGLQTGYMTYQRLYPKLDLLYSICTLPSDYATDQIRKLIPRLPDCGFRMLEMICTALSNRDCPVDLSVALMSSSDAGDRLDPMLVHALARTLRQGNLASKQLAVEFCLERRCSATAILLVLAFCNATEDQAQLYAGYVAERCEDIPSYVLREIVWQRNGTSSCSDIHRCQIAMLLLGEDCSIHPDPDESDVYAYVSGLGLLAGYVTHPAVREGIGRLVSLLADRDCSECRQIRFYLEEML